MASEARSAAEPTAIRDRLGKVALALWAGIVSVLFALLMAPHLAPFKDAAPRDATVAFAQRLTGTMGAWQVLHVVADGCACSSDVIEHLMQRGPDRRVGAEGVVFVGHSPELRQQLVSAGFAYVEQDEKNVARTTGVEAAPTMIAIDGAGQIRYAGGYYAGRARTKALDTDVLTDVMAGRVRAPLPLFGCAFSHQLQSAVDPLGIKYGMTR